jgi:hypothetical protein
MISMSDKLATVGTMLFILSMVSERIVSFIKLRSVEGKSFLFIVVPSKTESSSRWTDTVEEAKREKSILAINLTIGFLVAIAAHANFFDMFSNNSTIVGWDFSAEFDFKRVIPELIGCILTGMFISLGSKFWHDVVDLIFQIKNHKQKLNEKATIENDNILGSKQTEYENISEAIRPQKSQLMEIDNVVSVMLVYDKNRPSLIVHVSKDFDKNQLVPKKVYYKYNNTDKHIPVKIINDSEPTTHSFSPTDKIANAKPYPNNEGSMGGKVYNKDNNEPYFLSCYHVVKSPTQDWDDFKKSNDRNVLNHTTGNGSKAEIVEAFRDNEVDVAIMKSDTNISAFINGIGIPYVWRNLNIDDEVYGTSVRMFGAFSGFSEGTIVDIDLPVKLKYYRDDTDGMEWHQLDNVIAVKGLAGNFSRPGDSGSFVIDEYNYLIGVLVGGYMSTSYIMPIERVLRRTNTKITKI